MANPTMEPIAFIRKQLEEVEPDLLRELLHDVVDRVMAAEVNGLTGAAQSARRRRGPRAARGPEGGTRRGGGPRSLGRGSLS